LYVYTDVRLMANRIKSRIVRNEEHQRVKEG